jgi:glycosyltransferase involved in cell wall biosynthesis
MQQVKLSAVIITFNEEKNIERCLQSLQGVADEIVVVDSCSTDATVEICRRYNAAVVEQKWLGYGAQKNFANGIAKHEYILSIDADEALSDELKNAIVAELQSGNMADAYSMNRFTNYCGHWIKHCGWYPDKKVRLWRKEKADWEEDVLHEQLLFPPNSNICHLKGDLLHYSYHSIFQHMVQVNKFSEIAAKEKFIRGKKSSVLKIIFKSAFRFFRDYILKGGILDGYYGFIICKLSAFTVFLRYVKLLQLHREAKQNQSEKTS